MKENPIRSLSGIPMLPAMLAVLAASACVFYLATSAVAMYGERSAQLVLRTGALH